MREIRGNDAEIRFRALAEVDPSGQFFATQHTMERYQSAFYAPLDASLSNFGAWAETGEQTSTQGATEIRTKNLAGFQDPSHGVKQPVTLELAAVLKTRPIMIPKMDLSDPPLALMRAIHLAQPIGRRPKNCIAAI